MAQKLDWIEDTRELAKAKGAMASAEAFVKEQFGERCADFNQDCDCCQRWIAFDYLFGGILDDPDKRLLLVRICHPELKVTLSGQEPTP